MRYVMGDKLRKLISSTSSTSRSTDKGLAIAGFITLLILQVSIFLWLAVFYTVMRSIETLQGTQADDNVTVAVLVVVLLLLVLGSFRLRPDFSRFPWVVLVFLGFALLWFPSDVGAIVLRFLGVGGGIPTSILLHTPSPASNNDGLEAVRGCLVLSTASQLMIIPTDHMSDCELPQLLNTQPKVAASTHVLVIAKIAVLASGAYNQYHSANFPAHNINP